jgi:hypothetical protein
MKLHLFATQNRHGENNLRQDQNVFYGAQMVAFFVVSIKPSFLINPLRLIMAAGS